MSDQVVVEYKTTVQLKRMTQSQLVAYTKELQEALFGQIEDDNE